MNPYQKAGVNVNSGYEISKYVKQNVSKKSQDNIGNFGGIFQIPSGYKEPVLISGNDGVGTKLLLATESKIYDTVGIDCVAMCVNDILAQGATPLYFLDYIAAGKIDSSIQKIISGVIEGCRLGELDLIGGETAEMPDMYPNETFDLAGFVTGIAEKKDLLSSDNVKEGDKLVGIASSGLHSNGFSLVRKIFFKDNDFDCNSKIPELSGRALSEVLLEPTHIYTKQLMPLLKKKMINSASHITGGGFVENIPRMLPDNLAARIYTNSWPIPKVFKVVQKYGKISDTDMFNIFNMGIGMVIAIDPKDESSVLDILSETGQLSFVIGEVVTRSEKPIEMVGCKL